MELAFDAHYHGYRKWKVVQLNILPQVVNRHTIPLLQKSSYMQKQHKCTYSGLEVEKNKCW